MPFQVKVEATSGTLLGGIRIHYSSPFLKYENAESWQAQNSEANTSAGRKFTSKIQTKMAARRDCADYQS